MMPTVDAVGSQVFAYIRDFMGASMIGERRELHIESSPHIYFDQDLIAFRATVRNAINIHGDGRASTYGPIVALKAN